jgi:hypothetical protein
MEVIEKLTISEYAKRYKKYPQQICQWANEGLLELESGVVGTKLILDNDNNRATLFSLTRRKKK